MCPEARRLRPSPRVLLLLTAGSSLGTARAAEERPLAPAPPAVSASPDSAPAAGSASYRSVVRGPPPRPTTAATAVSADEARRLAGTQDDALKVVEDLPGVARPALGSGQIVVWGASPADTRVLVDGVEVPRLYHGGLRGVIDADLVRTIELWPGGHGAELGRALGGQVLVGTRRLIEDGVHGHLAADLLDSSALLTAALGARLHLAVAGRYGYFDRLVSLVAPGAAALVPIPGYDDYQAKVTLALRTGEELSAVLLGSDDHLRRTQPSADPASVRSDSTDASFCRAYLHYQARSASGDLITVTPSVGVDRNRSDLRVGATPAGLGEDALTYGLRAHYRTLPASWLALAVGLDLAGRRSRWSRAGSLGIPAREGDPYVFGRPPGSDVAADDWTTHVADFGPYVSADFTLGPLTISPGLRLDGLVVEGSRQTPRLGDTPSVGFTRIAWTLEPRLLLRWQIAGRLSLFAAGGLYHQPPDGADLSAVFGSPSLGPLRAAHAVAGGAIGITGSLRVEVVGFYRYLDDQVSRSALPAPALAQALTQDGTGWSYGGQLVLRQELWHGLAGWLTYTLERSDRRDHPGGEARRSSFDQTHVLTLVASYALGGWGFGLRFRYATGAPRTPVVDSFRDAFDDRWQPVLGRINSGRLPDFVQLDLRLERRIELGPLALRLYLDVQNVTNQENAEEITYRFNYRQHGYVRGLPALAVLGARLEF